jgi:hypothetical protein
LSRGGPGGLACAAPCRAHARRWSRAADPGRAPPHRRGAVVRGRVRRCRVTQRATIGLVAAPVQLRDRRGRGRPQLVVPVHDYDSGYDGGGARRDF